MFLRLQKQKFYIKRWWETKKMTRSKLSGYEKLVDFLYGNDYHRQEYYRDSENAMCEALFRILSGQKKLTEFMDNQMIVSPKERNEK